MPEVVARGRKPQVHACGYCHLPDGQGRPENAPLAGLPAAYIEAQVAAFRSGARRSDWHGPNRPTDLMLATAEHVAGWLYVPTNGATRSRDTWLTCHREALRVAMTSSRAAATASRFPAAAAMARTCVARLAVDDTIAIAAYVGSLEP